MRKFERLVIATTNKGKYEEFSSLVKGLADVIVFAPEIARLVVEETGRTYSQNALIKAQAWAQASGLPCLADDSGLEVNALGGAPGLYSARVVPGSDEDKVTWLLSRLEGVDDRSARFAASVALCVPDEFTLITEGYCYGNITHSPKGANGFGYDPVFMPKGYAQTFAELDADIKNSISHRTNAVRKLITALT